MTIKDLFNKVKSTLGVKKKTIPAPPILTPSQPRISIIIMANGKAIGAVQSVSVSETVEIPHVEVRASRVRFARERLEEAFGKGFLSEDSQVIPLKIAIIGDGRPPVEIHNLWISEPVGYLHQSDNWIIVDEIAMIGENIDGKL